MKIREKAHDFLERELPGLIGVVGTNGPDGFPHLVPVWYRWDRRRVHIWAQESRIWVQNLLRDPRTGFSVQEEVRPQRAVVMKGRSVVDTGEDPEIDAEIERITRRYVASPEDVAEYIAAWPELRTIVHIEPHSVLYRED